MEIVQRENNAGIAILLAIIATENEMKYVRERLGDIRASHERSNRTSKFKCLVVYQCADPENEDVSKLPGQHQVLPTDKFSASAARNLAIEWAHENAISHVIFNDVRVRVSESFFAAAEAAAKIDQPLVRCGHLAWSETDDRKSLPQTPPPVSIEFDERAYDPIRESYVGQFVFRADALRSLRFDERIGPGQNTSLKSGEDVLFIFDVLNSVGTHRVMTVASEATLFRKRRPADMSKQVVYAEGQGALYRSLLRNWRSWNSKLRVLIVKNFVLFAGNALVRILLLRPRSVEIAKLRLKGFLSS